jgi:hypothetical protein
MVVGIWCVDRALRSFSLAGTVALVGEDFHKLSLGLRVLLTLIAPHFSHAAEDGLVRCGTAMFPKQR